MTVRVRMAPSPTGFLHIGGVRTFLYNWLYARQAGGECRLRIENTDTSREVAESVEQIQRSLRWVGIDWDGEITFQLDRMERCQQESRRLLDEGKAYEDEGAIRFRMPDEGATAWEDAVRGRVEFQNERLADLVIVRSDGRPTYNFASPVEDWLDGITHVIRSDDHVSNTPSQINILRALGADPPVYAHASSLLGPDGRPLSKRHGAQSLDEFREAGYLPEALMNFLALLGWSYDDKTTIMSRDELVERFSLERVQSSPATFDYKKLEWMNGVYLRALSAEDLAERLVEYVREQGYDWDEHVLRNTVPIVQEKISTLGAYPEFAGFFFQDVDPDVRLLDASVLVPAAERLGQVDPFTAEPIEQALRALADELELSPRKAFQPIRVAVTGSKISPGLFESLELLGKERSLGRIRAATGCVGREVDSKENVDAAGTETTVLVVEDDTSMRLLCRVNLELEGFRVLEGPTVPEARRLLGSEKIDFVVLDVHIGGDSGYDLIDAIREQQNAPIALITGSAEISTADRELVDTVLPKPFELSTLAAEIRRLVAARRSADQV